MGYLQGLLLFGPRCICFFSFDWGNFGFFAEFYPVRILGLLTRGQFESNEEGYVCPIIPTNENAILIINTLNELTTSKTGLETANYVQNSNAIQEIQTHSGKNESNNSTEDRDNPLMKFNIDAEEKRVFTTAGVENSPLHIILGHELAHFFGKFKDENGPKQY
jgi:hypothetical protein